MSPISGQFGGIGRLLLIDDLLSQNNLVGLYLNHSTHHLSNSNMFDTGEQSGGLNWGWGQRGQKERLCKHTSMDTFCSDKVFSDGTVTVGVTEFNGCQWRTTTGIVDDCLDDTAKVTLAFSKIQRTVLGSTLAKDGVSYLVLWGWAWDG